MHVNGDFNLTSTKTDSPFPSFWAFLPTFLFPWKGKRYKKQKKQNQPTEKHTCVATGKEISLATLRGRAIFQPAQMRDSSPRGHTTANISKKGGEVETCGQES